jgi:hypothetical protein
MKMLKIQCTKGVIRRRKSKKDRQHNDKRYGQLVNHIQHYVIKFVSDLQWIGGFLRVL